MDSKRSAREILGDIDLAVRRLQAEHVDCPRREDVTALRLSLAPLRRELDESLALLEGDSHLRRLSTELGQLFVERSGPREFCEVALAAIGRLMRASATRVVAIHEDGSAVVLAEQRDDAAVVDEPTGISRTLLNEVVAKREAVRVSDARDSEHGQATSVARMDLRSILIAPLVLSGRVEGAIYLENTRLAGAFTESDRVMLQSVAALLAPYVHVGGRLDAALEERDRLHAALEGDIRFHGIIGRSPAMRRLVATIERLRDSDVSVLVQGESGTGKELVAGALHASSRRSGKPLVVVNCAAIPEGLMESELFGHERGAFTGATERRVGRFEQAQGGTLFLDEVGELRVDLQAKLLRVLQEQRFERVGGSETIRVDVRVLAATNRDLDEQVAAGKFRADLYYRLHVVPIAVPALRERPEDIPVLAQHFLDELSASGRRARFGAGVVQALERHAFPGNVRELRNLVHRLHALCEADVIALEDLPAGIQGSSLVSLDKDPLRRFLKHEPRTQEDLKALRARMQEVFASYLRQVERRFLEAALARASGNVSLAARETGVNRTVFHRRLKELEDDDSQPAVTPGGEPGG